MLDVGDIVSFELDGTRYVGRLLKSARISRDPLVRFFCPEQGKFHTSNIPWNDMGRANPADTAQYLAQSKAFNAREEKARLERMYAYATDHNRARS